MPEVSLIIPIYNEVDNVLALAERLENSLGGEDYEIIFVDDGSTDNSLSLLKQLDFAPVTVISFSKNFGHMAALRAGYRAARGEFIVTMDGDLQHPPELIVELLIAQKTTGADVVYAVRSERKEDSFFKRVSSAIYYRLLSSMAGFKIRKSAADFRLITKRVQTALLSRDQGQAVYRVLIPSLGFREAEVPYVAESRFAGTPKYNLTKMIKLFVESVIATSTRPLMFAILIGGLSIVMSLLGTLFVLFSWFSGSTITGWASTVSILFLLFGLMSVNMGIFGLYLGNLSKKVNGSGDYTVSEVWEAER